MNLDIYHYQDKQVHSPAKSIVHSDMASDTQDGIHSMWQTARTGHSEKMAPDTKQFARPL